MSKAFFNGQLIEQSEISDLAFTGFAHFTAMQVRNKAVKGLDLHLARLRDASKLLFNNHLADEDIINGLTSVLAHSDSDLSLTITMYSPKGEFNTASMNVTPNMLIRTNAPSNGPIEPLTLAAIEHQRTLANIKHVGEIAKTHCLHLAKKQGFDDAVFINQSGVLSEATIWNLAFWDGESVIWPKADMLKGTMMGIIQRQLTALNIPQKTMAISLHTLRNFTGAVVMNSWTPAVSVNKIANMQFSQSQAFQKLLHNAYENEPFTYLNR
ncbi:aminotransferase class IV family protein [Pseudoalteromonas spongiae]|uniref:aminotransferase class IV family protein n=1 Tax=Pseudoalteromonas spongiae TaxID=298657 RepID=UPI00110A545A|nr:aminotransferase class IV family protein [Pseudoalteromonas spongiae]TMO88449.1 aminotransferase class IV [Pseudoalteromonas spongiae]